MAMCVVVSVSQICYDGVVDQLSKSQRLLAEKTLCVLMLRGQNAAGEAIYAYVAVRADKIEAFMAAQQKPGFNPEEYGVIIESGTGDPNPEIRMKMEQEYGFNHEKMVFLSSD